jgi:hypothetical protein
MPPIPQNDSHWPPVPNPRLRNTGARRCEGRFLISLLLLVPRQSTFPTAASQQKVPADEPIRKNRPLPRDGRLGSSVSCSPSARKNCEVEVHSLRSYASGSIRNLLLGPGMPTPGLPTQSVLGTCPGGFRVFRSRLQVPSPAPTFPPQHRKPCTWITVPPLAPGWSASGHRP